MRDSAVLREWDNQFVWHPFTPMLAYRDEDAPIIEAADGFFLIDVEGRRYLDGISSLWCNVHGHRVPEIDRAVREQLDRVAHTTLLGLSSVPSIELARELVARAPARIDQSLLLRQRRDGRRSRPQDRLPVPHTERGSAPSLRGATGSCASGTRTTGTRWGR